MCGFVGVIFLLGSEDVLQSFHGPINLLSSNILRVISFLLGLGSSPQRWKNIDFQTIRGIFTIFIGISMSSLVYILVVLYLLLEVVVKNSAELSITGVGFLIGIDAFGFLMFLIFFN